MWGWGSVPTVVERPEWSHHVLLTAVFTLCLGRGKALWVRRFTRSEVVGTPISPPPRPIRCPPEGFGGHSEPEELCSSRSLLFSHLGSIFPKWHSGSHPESNPEAMSSPSLTSEFNGLTVFEKCLGIAPGGES